MDYFERNIRAAFLAILFVVAFIEVRAQTNMVFYPLEEQFNASTYNPAFLYSDSQYSISVFPLAGINLGYNNQDVIRELSEKLLKGINTDEEYLDVVKTMVKRNSFNQRMDVDFLNFTLRTGNGFFNFRLRENTIFSASIKGPVSSFMIDPKYRSVEVGRSQHVPILIVHYREYSLAYSSPASNHDFSWGVRGKLYYGKAVFSSTISGSVDRLADYHYFMTDGSGLLSAPVEDDGTLKFNSSLIADYLMNNENAGVGVDLGLRLKLNPRTTFTLSILDWGNILWKSNLSSKDFRSRSLLESSKLSVSTENGVEIVSKTADSISFDNKFKHIFNAGKKPDPFRTALPRTIFSGVKYEVNSKLDINLVNRFVKLEDMNQNTFMVSAGYDLNRKLSVTGGLQLGDMSYLNMPVGLLLRDEFGQAYIGTDNLLTFLNPERTEFSGLTFGVSFHIFRNRKLWGNPEQPYPFFRPKKVKKVLNNGRIQKEKTELGFPEFY